jgi:hypothetical protein
MFGFKARSVFSQRHYSGPWDAALRVGKLEQLQGNFVRQLTSLCPGQPKPG